MWLRESSAARKAVRNIARAPGPSTRARRDATRTAPQAAGPAFTDALLWGIGKWGYASWARERFAPRLRHFSGRWGVARWKYAFWRRSRTRVG